CLSFSRVATFLFRSSHYVTWTSPKHRVEMNLRRVMIMQCNSSAYTLHTSQLQVNM
ncbi:hypothetical protein M378DRAFT_173621, partial [Amanita muscaria Koide BX008]